MKLVSVVGARPQFIKAAPVSRAIREAGHVEILLHTGQHYAYEMSEIFFRELGIPEPDLNLGVGSGTHGTQTAQMLTGIEEVLMRERPDLVLVHGDTNSTLAGSLASCKLRIPVAHNEAGLRSHNREMPEEHNRVLTDHCSDLLFCPTSTAVANLQKEGITKGVFRVGDTMYDALLQCVEIAREKSTVLEELGLDCKGYIVATVHRPYNTDSPENLVSILSALIEMDEPVIFPVHPRTRIKISQLSDKIARKLADSRLEIIAPVGYLDMLILQQSARLILTDSGGVQREAYFLGVPCLTLRPETELTETVEAGWNVVVGTDKQRILDEVKHHRWPNNKPPALFGEGRASQRIVSALTNIVG